VAKRAPEMRSWEEAERMPAAKIKICKIGFIAKWVLCLILN
jgi:hypothetical protein